jgi:lipopolysaccharide/colanic/teichoic acid biosynthesis glycosyltransferase
MSKEIKRVLDIVIAAFLLITTSPIWLLSCVMVWIRMGRPILFRQERAGFLGRVFTLYKVRTMSCETDAFGDPLPVTNRLTPLGRTLRHLSIDELPQLWNVIRGDMSLIGPRPLLASYLPRYNDYQRRRHLMRPGITGYAQVAGRNALTWEAKFDLDIYYVSRWSLWLDLRIAIKTIWAVISAANTEELGLPSENEFLGTEHGCVATDNKGQRQWK